MSRYPDILAAFGMLPKPLVAVAKHYQDFGIFEGRNKFCAPRITDQEAQCYLNRYPDLQTTFGKDSWVQAKKHWGEFGFNEGRSTKCEKGPIVKCAEEGGKCQCSGMIFYTRANEDFSKAI
jgi:hypothetical protein